MAKPAKPLPPAPPAPPAPADPPKPTPPAKPGGNSVAAEKLRAYVERIERIEAQIKEWGDDKKAVFAESKANGFDGKALRQVLSRRKKKPGDLAEEEAITETYLHAMGMAVDPPLFRAVGMIAVDPLVRDQCVEALKRFVPAGGSIVVEAGGVPVRLTRNDKGEVSVTDVINVGGPAAPAGKAAAAATAITVMPDIDDLSAAQLGRDAHNANEAIVKNPFPFGDRRRAHWDAGWREASGGDGMGPGGED